MSSSHGVCGFTEVYLRGGTSGTLVPMEHGGFTLAKGVLQMPLPREEQGTTVNWEYESETMTLATTYPPHMRALVKLGYEPKVSRVVTKWNIEEDKKGRVTQTPAETDEVSWHFTLPAKFFKLPRAPKRVSETQRASAAERMRRK